MRTTINIDEDVLEYAKLAADVQNISLGDALSRIARRGINAPQDEMQKDPVSGFWTFNPSAGSRKITSRDVQEAIKQEYVEEFEKCFPKR